MATKVDYIMYANVLQNARLCPVCGKEFYVGAEWGYVFRSKEYCTYKCMRAAEKEGAKKGEQRRIEAELNGDKYEREREDSAPGVNLGDRLEQQIVDMYYEGLSYSEIAIQLEIYWGLVREIIGRRTGKGKNSRALSEDQCKNILGKYHRGVSVEKLADQYRVSQTMIRRVVRGDYL